MKISQLSHPPHLINTPPHIMHFLAPEHKNMSEILKSKRNFFFFLNKLLYTGLKHK